MILTLEESNYAGPIPEDEILPARVTGVKEVVKPWKDDHGEEIRRVEFSFQIDDPTSAFDGSRLWGDTSLVFSNNPSCRLYAWVQEIYGQELPVGFVLDTDDLTGKTCRVVVAQRTYKDKSGEEKVRNFVKDLIRPRDGTVYTALEEPPF